jgi:TolA-binding protein
MTKVFTLVQKTSTPVLPETPARLRRSDSFTGLSTVSKNVNDLTNLVAMQETALNEAISHLQKAEQQILEAQEQIERQNQIIQEQTSALARYEKLLTEHDDLIEKIIG